MFALNNNCETKHYINNVLVYLNARTYSNYGYHLRFSLCSRNLYCLVYMLLIAISQHPTTEPEVVQQHDCICDIGNELMCLSFVSVKSCKSVLDRHSVRTQFIH